MPINFAMSAMSVVEFALWVCARLPVLEEGPSWPFPSYGKLLGSARGIGTGVHGSPLYSIAALGPQFDSGLFYIFRILLLCLLGGIYCQRSSALLRLHRGFSLRAVGVPWIAEIRDSNFPLGDTSFGHRQLIYCQFRASVTFLSFPKSPIRLMRSVSIVELCLLAFLCLSMNALHLSVRDMAFGIALGFGVMSSSDFIIASFWTRRTLIRPSTVRQ
jgi:hypothetical protein